MKVLFKAALAAAVALVPASAHATVIFNVSGTYVGGGTLTGTFATNDTFTVLEAVNLTSTAQNGLTITNVASASLVSLPNALQFTASSPGRWLVMNFSPALTAAGAAIGDGSYYAQGNQNNRTALSGTVAAATAAAVPEPTTWAMMLVGFGAIGAGMRSRKRQAVRLNLA